MKVVIFYFSQTLNTKKYAEKIAEGIREIGHQCQLIRFKKKDNDIELIKKFDFSYDLIGFGTPVYYFLDILEQLPSLEGKRGFLFCTSGGNPGSTLNQIKMITDKKGLKIIDGSDKFIGFDRHPLYRDFDFIPQLRSNISNGIRTSGHPTEEDLENAKKWAMQMMKKAENPNIPEKIDFHARDSEYAKMQTLKMINRTYPKFNLNEKKCIQKRATIKKRYNSSIKQ